MNNDRKYSNGEITVFWKPDLCIHSEICFRSLPRVFNPKRKPWIKMEASTTDKIIEVVNNCPTDALTYKRNNQMNEPDEKQSDAVRNEIKMMQNGPFIILGKFKIMHFNGTEINIDGKVALCRCGASGKHPYCDGSHRKIDFKG